MRMEVVIAYHVHDVLECCLRLAVVGLPEWKRASQKLSA